MTKKQILLIDGDCVAFRVAAACEKRSVRVKHIKSGKEIILKNRTELKKLCFQKNITYDENSYIFTDIQTAEPENYARNTVKQSLQRIKDKFPGAECEVVVQGEGNFRDRLPLPHLYKGDREQLLRPTNLSCCKDQLIKMGARQSKDCESDDYVIYRGYEYKAKGYDVIVVTNDKDANAYHGLSVWDFTNPDSDVHDIGSFGDVGHLYKTPKGKVKGHGFMWCMHQLLIGDSTDCYKPQDLTAFSLKKPVKFADMGSYNIISDLKTKQEIFNVVVKKYKDWFPEPFVYVDCFGVEHTDVTYLDVMKLYWKCVRMKTYPDDEVDLLEFVESEGLSFE